MSRARRQMAAWLYREAATASNRRIDHWERIALTAERDRNWAGWALKYQKKNAELNAVRARL